MSLLDTKQQPNYPCGCIGPQGGAPYCPCGMRERGLEQPRFATPITPAEKASLYDKFREVAK